MNHHKGLRLPSLLEMVARPPKSALSNRRDQFWRGILSHVYVQYQWLRIEKEFELGINEEAHVIKKVTVLQHKAFRLRNSKNENTSKRLYEFLQSPLKTVTITQLQGHQPLHLRLLEHGMWPVTDKSFLQTATRECLNSTRTYQRLNCLLSLVVKTHLNTLCQFILLGHKSDPNHC